MFKGDNMKNTDQEVFNPETEAFQCSMCRQWHGPEKLIATQEAYYDKNCYTDLDVCECCGMGSETIVEREFKSFFGYLYSQNICAICDKKSDDELKESVNTFDKYDNKVNHVN